MTTVQAWSWNIEQGHYNVPFLEQKEQTVRGVLLWKAKSVVWMKDTDTERQYLATHTSGQE